MRGDQLQIAEDDGKAFRLHERLEELFRLPDDADADQIKVFYKHGTLEIRWAYWVGNAAIAVAVAGYLGVFWGDVQTTNWLAALAAVGAIWLFTLVNILGARETGVAQVLTTVLKFVPLVVIGLVGLFYIEGG